MFYHVGSSIFSFHAVTQAGTISSTRSARCSSAATRSGGDHCWSTGQLGNSHGSYSHLYQSARIRRMSLMSCLRIASMAWTLVVSPYHPTYVFLSALIIRKASLKPTWFQFVPGFHDCLEQYPRQNGGGTRQYVRTLHRLTYPISPLTASAP